MNQNPRQLAFLALRSVHQGAYADVALDRILGRINQSLPGSARNQATVAETLRDRRLITELVYGSVRRMRSLDALIDQLGKKKAHQQPPDLRTILHLGFYQLRYLDQIPASAAVNSTVELAKQNGFKGLAGVVNGLMRQYTRLSQQEADPLKLPDQFAERLGVLHSYPDWMIQEWLKQLDPTETEQLCEWLNQPPYVDLRVNTLQTSVEAVETAIQLAGVLVKRVPLVPQALRLVGNTGPIQSLPGFAEGWWTVQDSSAQLVSQLLDPQPGDIIIDACAAPGGKSTHLAELMADQGTIWACDRTPSRLKRLKANVERLGLQSIQIQVGDSRNLPQFMNQANRVLLDAPCSGLGTLHRHADARWRQTPETVQELSQLQAELLNQAATWVKPGGVLVYATCTLHPLENEQQVQAFLAEHPHWQIEPPAPEFSAAELVDPKGWIRVWPHRHQMDGFFMVRLRQNPT